MHRPIAIVLAAALIGLGVARTAAATPPVNPAPVVTAAVPAPAPTEGVVNLNTASVEELRRLPGIGEAKATRIIAQRTRHPFKHIEELVRVKGIGRKTFRKLKPLLTVTGPTTLMQRPRRAAH